MEYEDKLARFNFIMDKIINFGIENHLMGQGYGNEDVASSLMNEIMYFMVEELM